MAGSAGMLSHNGLERATLMVEALAPPASGVAVPVSVGVESPYRRKMEDFVRGIRDIRPFQVEPEEGVEALRLALWADAAARVPGPLTRGAVNEEGA